MNGVIDVSGMIEILLQKEKLGKFRKIFEESSHIIAPDLFIPELTNTFWKYYTAKLINKDECVKFIRDGINFIDKFVDSKEMWEEAFSEGIKNNHSIYDMFYLITARRNNGILITNDSVLAGICKKYHLQLCY